jgi:hypothetical protein
VKIIFNNLEVLKQGRRRGTVTVEVDRPGQYSNPDTKIAKHDGMTIRALQQLQARSLEAVDIKSSSQIESFEMTSQGRRPFADAIPTSSRRFIRPIFTVLLASIGGFQFTGSPFIGVVMFFMAIIGALADIFANIILVPPFLQTGEALCMDKAKLPTYWDSASIQGPSAFHHTYSDVEIPMHGKFLRGWLIRPKGAPKVQN